MNINSLLNLSQLEDLNLEIMFAAAPQSLVTDISRTLFKRKAKNLFYILFGVYLQESEQYIVFESIFKKIKKPMNGNYFKEISVESHIFDTKQEVTNFIYDFKSGFSEHQRFIFEESMALGMMPADEAFSYILGWNANIFEFFNLYIKGELGAE